MLVSVIWWLVYICTCMPVWFRDVDTAWTRPSEQWCTSFLPFLPFHCRYCRYKEEQQQTPNETVDQQRRFVLSLQLLANCGLFLVDRILFLLYFLPPLHPPLPLPHSPPFLVFNLLMRGVVCFLSCGQIFTSNTMDFSLASSSSQWQECYRSRATVTHTTDRTWHTCLSSHSGSPHMGSSLVCSAAQLEAPIPVHGPCLLHLPTQTSLLS